MKRTIGALAIALTLAAAAPAAAGASGQLTIDFQTTTTGGDPHAARTVGTVSMTGALADAGTAITAYRVAGTRVDATATLIGARGILTIAMRGTLGGIVDGQQRAAGRWAVCGGTGPYRRLAGRGQWQSVADIGAAMMPLAVRGALTGPVSRSFTPPRAASPSSSDPHC
jgi:hypothetical protein